MSELAIRRVSLRIPPRKWYLFLPGMLVPKWIQRYEPNKSADEKWADGCGRFMSAALVKRESGAVYVWPMGVDVCARFVVSAGTTLIGAPTMWDVSFLLPLTRRDVISMYIERRK